MKEQGSSSQAREATSSAAASSFGSLDALRAIWPGLGQGNRGDMREPSATKCGPGRRHKSGHQKASPIKQRGAPMGFVQHEAHPRKKLRRANVEALGRRQAIKATKRERREALPEGLSA